MLLFSFVMSFDFFNPQTALAKFCLIRVYRYTENAISSRCLPKINTQDIFTCRLNRVKCQHQIGVDTHFLELLSYQSSKHHVSGCPPVNCHDEKAEVAVFLVCSCLVDYTSQSSRNVHSTPLKLLAFCVSSFGYLALIMRYMSKCETRPRGWEKGMS